MQPRKVTTVLALMLGAVNLLAFSQSPTGIQGTGSPERITVWNGVFTESQATRGQAVYSTRCERCHGNDLTGGAVGTSLKGDRFMQFWREDNVDSLFSKIRDTMPRNSASLGAEEYLNVTAFILQKNDFPAGAAELKPETMRSIHIEGKDGPKPLPTNSMIQIVGCMTAAGDGWTLTQVSAPTRTRTSDAISPEELMAARNAEPGTATFRLQNLLMLGELKPEVHKGHKMLAKGPLLRRSNAEFISVTALDMVADRCGP